ncbi:MAG: TonB-dependent receptor [Bacteroidota bacterium]
MKYFLALTLGLAANFAFGQTYSISGIVLDSTSQQSLPGATVVLSTADGVQTKATTTNSEGAFQIDQLLAGGYKISLSYVGYKPWSKWVMLRNADRDLGNLILASSVSTLENVEIKGQAVPTVQNGDTTEYNADAYKTNPDADAADLLKKMPGVVIQNGQVQAQGEGVKQVFVDGKEFFGNDPTLALRTLPAEVIQKIQVYDRQSDQAQFTGFDDGETTKAINIITRPEKRNGQFGKVYGGYGYDDRYRLGGNVNVFDEDRRISVIGQANNINQQNFATEDLLGVVNSNGNRNRGGFRGGRPGGGGAAAGGRGGRNLGGSSVNDFLVGQQGGISTTNAFGLNYTDNWGEQWDINGSYFFNNSLNNALELTNRIIYREQGVPQQYQEESQSNSDNFNHRLNLRLVNQINSHNSLIIQPRVSFQSNRATSLQTAETTEGDRLLNAIQNNITSDISGYNFATNLLFRHRFEKRGRTFSARINTTVNQQDGLRSLLAENRSFGQSTAFSDTIDQEADFIRNGWNLGSNLVYTEPLGPGMMQFTYGANFQREFSDKKTFNFDETEQSYSILDTLLTNEFSSLYSTQSLGTGYRVRSGDLMLMAGVRYQWATLSSDQVFPQEFTLERDFANVLPSAMLRYKISDTKNLRLFYRTNTQAPSVTQLQEVVDNSNPLQLTVGNAELDQQYRHSLFIRYSSANPEKSNTFFAFLGGTVTEDYVGNATYIAQQDTLIGGDILLAEGAQLVQSVNVGQQRSIRSFITYGKPVSFLKSNLNINLSGNLTQTPGLINDQRNDAINSSLGVGLVLSSNISENVDFTLSSNSSFNWVNNSIRTELNDQYFNQNSAAELTWIFWKGLVFRSQINHQLYSGLSEGFNQNFVLWNMSLGKKFLKDRRGELELSVFDLLKQNQSIHRNVTEAYLEDIQTQVLQQYFMLTFTYQIRHFKI